MAHSTCTDSDMEEGGESDDENYEDYYNTGEDCDMDHADLRQADPEYFEYECLSIEEVENLLNEAVESLSDSLEVIIL